MTDANSDNWNRDGENAERVIADLLTPCVEEDVAGAAAEDVLGALCPAARWLTIMKFLRQISQYIALRDGVRAESVRAESVLKFLGQHKHYLVHTPHSTCVQKKVREIN